MIISGSLTWSHYQPSFFSCTTCRLVPHYSHSPLSLVPWLVCFVCLGVSRWLWREGTSRPWWTPSKWHKNISIGTLHQGSPTFLSLRALSMILIYVKRLITLMSSHTLCAFLHRDILRRYADYWRKVFGKSHQRAIIYILYYIVNGQIPFVFGKSQWRTALI